MGKEIKDDERILRDYVRCEIKECSADIRRISYENQIDIAIFYNELMSHFIGGNIFKNEQIEEIKRINSSRKTNNKTVAPLYAYFNLDTLIAYNAFIDKFIEMYDCKKSSLTHVFRELDEHFSKYTGKAESGYYNKKKPVTLINSKKPEFPMNSQKFVSMARQDPRYNKQKLSYILRDYLANKNKSDTSNIGYQIEDQPSFETVTIAEPMQTRKEDRQCFRDKNNILFNNETYVVVSKDTYYDIETNPVDYICAVSDRNKLYGAFYHINGEPYHGQDLYDEEGNWSMSGEDASIEVYSKNVKILPRSENENQKVTIQSGCKIREDGQITLM